MEQAYNKLKEKHGLDIVLLVIGVAFIVAAFIIGQLALIFFAIIPTLLGLLAFFGIRKKMKELDYIRDNYRTDPSNCMDIINKRIQEKIRSIGNDQFKAEYGSREDRHDSKKDVIRKTKELESLREIQAEIEKYC